MGTSNMNIQNFGIQARVKIGCVCEHDQYAKLGPLQLPSFFVFEGAFLLIVMEPEGECRRIRLFCRQLLVGVCRHGIRILEVRIVTHLLLPI